ncbi:MAG TPA: DUF2760 domain-containing protein [Bryobacteraceae bacterium]
MNRISLAFRSFFSILFGGKLPPEVAQAFGYFRAGISQGPPPAPAAKPTAPAKPSAGPADGAVQILAVLQRDARFVDFLMEDISGFPDEQVGAAVRDVQTQARETLARYLRLEPVIDSVEGVFTKAEGLDPAEVKFIGNVPASGKAPGGLLRHKGWKAAKIDLPQATPGAVLAPAELEVE